MMQAQTIETVLPKVVAYAEAYRQKLPALQCDEAIVSRRVHQGKVLEESAVTSTLREIRTEGGPEPFRETHLFKTVDGRAAVPGKHYDIPYFVQGSVANGLGFRPDLLGCYDYRLTGRLDGKTLRIEGARKAEATDPACEITIPQSTSVAIVDAMDYRVLRVERRVPGRIAESRGTVHFVEIEYGPVTLSGHTYWLPARAESHDELNERRFEVRYSNYHLYGASITILPGVEKVPE